LAPVAASVAAQLATAPLSAATFGVLYPVGIVATVVVTPLIVAFMAVGSAGVVAGAFGLNVLVVPLRWVVEAIQTVLDRVVWWCGGVRPVYADAPGVSMVLSLLAVLLLAGGWLYQERTTRWTGIR
jgi:competence protein ComEC